jgi:hypothetical protein
MSAIPPLSGDKQTFGEPAKTDAIDPSRRFDIQFLEDSFLKTNAQPPDLRFSRSSSPETHRAKVARHIEPAHADRMASPTGSR